MQAIGTDLEVARQVERQQQLEHALEDAGQRRDRAELDVRRRARQRAGVREAVHQRHEDLHHALAPQFLVRVERRAAVVRETVGHARAQQALDGGDEHDRDHEVGEVEQHARRGPGTAPGGVKTKKSVGNRAVLVADAAIRPLSGPCGAATSRRRRRARSAAPG